MRWLWGRKHHDQDCVDFRGLMFPKSALVDRTCPGQTTYTSQHTASCWQLWKLPAFRKYALGWNVRQSREPHINPCNSRFQTFTSLRNVSNSLFGTTNAAKITSDNLILEIDFILVNICAFLPASRDLEKQMQQLERNRWFKHQSMPLMILKH